LGYGALMDLNEGGTLAVDEGQDLTTNQDLKDWNELSLYGLIMLILDLYTDTCVVL